MGMGRAEQTGRGTGAASGQEVGGRSAGMPPVVICGWAGGPEGRMGLPKLYVATAVSKTSTGGSNPPGALSDGVEPIRHGEPSLVAPLRDSLGPSMILIGDRGSFSGEPIRSSAAAAPPRWRGSRA